MRSVRANLKFAGLMRAFNCNLSNIFDDECNLKRTQRLAKLNEIKRLGKFFRR